MVANRCVAVVPAGNGADVFESRNLWNRAFCTAMDELARQSVNGQRAAVEARHLESARY